MKLIIFALMMVLATSSAYAYDYDRAIASLSDECAQCSSFYLIGKQAVKTAGNDYGDVKKLHDASIKAFDFAVMTSDQKNAEARLSFHTSEMMNEINFDISNFSKLLAKYGDTCKPIVEKPFLRLKYWVDKK